MAVETTNAYSGPFAANGVTTAFPFTFSTMSGDDVSVIRRDADGVESTVSPTDYSVSLVGAAPSAGTVTFDTAPSSGYGIYILLDPPFTQEIQFEDGSPWLARPVNNANDRSALRDQALKRDVDRALKSPIGDPEFQLPSADERKGKFLGFSAVDGAPVAADGVGGDAILREDLASPGTGKGAGLVHFDPDEDYANGTIGKWAKSSFPLSMYTFSAFGDGTTNDTAAYTLLAAACGAGHSIHWPTGRFLVDADVGEFSPPASYNNLNYRPPAITASADSYVIARTGGEYLMKLGHTAADYSGYLRDAEFQLPVIDGNNKAFTKRALYAPFFLDIKVDVTVRNGGAQWGDTTAPGPSAGLKGTQNYENEINPWRRDTTSITNAVNPVVTFASPHGLWPSSGRRAMSINMFGPPAGWNAIAGKSLDVLITSATTVQLLNVDSTGFGAFAGFAACYLNMASMRVPKQIAGVTNANPCVVTTAIPHLYTSGDVVDLAEIGGMYPDRYKASPYTGLQGQYTVTVLSTTTFSIPVNTTDTTIYGTYSSAKGPGWAMAWVAPADCDIAAYYDNATDCDTISAYSKHYRIHQYHNPITCGYDGKHTVNHYYNFPERGEGLCHIWAGGDNHFGGLQSDGPFRYVLMLDGPNNTALGCKTNSGYIDPRNMYGAFARGMNANAGLECEQLGLKGKPSNFFWSDWSGLGEYITSGTNRYNSVLLPIDTAGKGKRAAAATFSMVTGSLAANIQCGASFIRTPGGFLNGDRIATFLRPVPITAFAKCGPPGGSAHATQAATFEEDVAWGPRDQFTRRFISRVGGTPTDLNSVSFEFDYPN